jgi:HAD superfamily hydrolase (TIGR01509 family)
VPIGPESKGQSSFASNRPAAVICDMDGLLVDSERMERRVWRVAAIEHGIEMTDERFASFVGHPSDEGERMLRRYYGDSFDVAAFRASCHRGMREIMASEGVTLRPGAREWLTFVAELGIPLAVATSSGPLLMKERLGELHSLFGAVVTRADVARGKPFPDLYLEAARRLGVAPAKCVALEDSPTGARAALAAGMPVIVVPDLVAVPAELSLVVEAVFDSLDELRAAVADGWNTQ